jgi:hypothetical protein
MIKVAKNNGYFYNFKGNLPKVNNRTNGENWPNPVTLLPRCTIVQLVCGHDSAKTYLNGEK